MAPVKNEIALVTGGSRGIGAATSLKLAEMGYTVCVNYRSRSAEANAVVKTIQNNGGEAFAIQADISDEDAVLALFAAIDAKARPLACLVNNGGVLFTQSRLEDMTVERFNTVFSVNVTGSFLCAREAVRRMSVERGGKGGVIVNVSSGAARSGSPNEYVDYAASKGAIDTLTVGLAKEVASQGIRVNGVRPGFIYTDIHADGGEPNRVDRLAKNIPLQRGGEPVEVASVICFLVSAESTFMTGSILDVTGGV
ncbi:SDR family oxidoreductase [Enterovibrio coralii]|uniref:Sugar dehydrogenase n=1 Tax=Enterovibrio coralii TaxID=294935 RepID=A0A135I4W3_9GAMM|nr:SDR family oxidoreductase [Enterovibrio coralii]KXF80490.1 hypothetical protein ATN88_22225 [Enterovibrio coralii]